MLQIAKYCASGNDFVFFTASMGQTVQDLHGLFVTVKMELVQMD